MSANAVYLLSMLAANLPFAAIAGIVVHYFFKRAAWNRARRLGRSLRGFCPSSAMLGAALLFMQAFTRPAMTHVLEARYEEDAEDEEAGDQEGITAQLHLQLKRVRRGERVEALVLRL